MPGLLEPQLRRRSVTGAAPWLRLRTRLRESDALRLTLTGHTYPVEACAISPDSRFIVTASGDDTCKIWDAATGKERATLTGHTREVGACAISPDSTFIVTTSNDGTCRFWDADTGKQRASLPLLGPGTCVALHPWQPIAVCGDSGGGVYLIDLVGVDYGPIVVTAVDVRNATGPAVRCPKCLQLHPLNDAWLGEVIECPTPECGLSLRVNPFVTRMAKGRRA
jgi:WD40 repeat protein